jgi:hypothetical protein
MRQGSQTKAIAPDAFAGASECLRATFAGLPHEATDAGPNSAELNCCT